MKKKLIFLKQFYSRSAIGSKESVVKLEYITNSKITYVICHMKKEFVCFFKINIQLFKFVLFKQKQSTMLLPTNFLVLLIVFSIENCFL